jgi:hypothetical protein
MFSIYSSPHHWRAAFWAVDDASLFLFLNGWVCFWDCGFAESPCALVVDFFIFLHVFSPFGFPGFGVGSLWRLGRVVGRLGRLCFALFGGLLGGLRVGL